MAEVDDLQGLQLLHGDLLALSESRLCNVDRLWAQLETRITEFRQLLDKNGRNDASRNKLTSGNVTIQQVEYQLNDQFQQNALEISGQLELDELDAARLILEATGDAELLGRSVVECAIIRFHQSRHYLLGCFRMILEQSTRIEDDEDQNDHLRDAFSNAVDAIFDHKRENGSATVRKCLTFMGDIKVWLQKIADRANGNNALGNTLTPQATESLEYQRTSLTQQHENLGLIVFHLVKGMYSNKDDFERVLDVIQAFDRYDHLLVHYFPIIGMYISIFGAQDHCSIHDARKINAKLMSTTTEWTLRYVQAAIRTWWLSEYSGRYTDNYTGTPIPGFNQEEESNTRVEQFSEALKDGAFDFLLSLSADVKSVDWLDPARHGLRQWLLRKAPGLVADSVFFSDTFQDVLMEQLEAFIDAFVTNLPDVLRRLRTDEDEQRQLSQSHEHDLDLERFLVIISYVFENRPEAALNLFWADAESNLSGFLQWVSRRASTPLMSAFCEMLQSLAGNDECATSAHEFLLDDGNSVSGKMRKNHSLSWAQIFRELKFFTDKIRDTPALPQSAAARTGKGHSDQAEAEPESAMMLESYLRLITQLCAESTVTREFLLRHTTFHILDIIYQLASSSIPARLRACAFKTLRALSSQRTREESEYIWQSLDVWISGGYSPGSSLPRGTVSASASIRAMNGIFEQIKSGFEEPNAFVQLLDTLISPLGDERGLSDCLPFSESLGSANRMPGIDPYVDFVLKDVFVLKNREVSDVAQLRLIHLSCLSFVHTCLTTFNEDLVVFANHSSISVDGAIRASNLTAYVCLHPFARIMEWIFNDKVMSVLFELVHQDPTEVARSAPDSPLVLCLLLAVDVITLAMALQSTYLNIVRPIVKLQPSRQRNIVANAAYASFEDGILNNLSIFADLGLFIGVGHPALSASSIKLLTILSTAPKLVASPSQGSSRNKAIVALEVDNESDRVARSLLNELLAPVDLVPGIEAPGFAIKVQILDFLIAGLQSVQDRPTMAHLLLGFQCTSAGVQVQNDSAFAREESIFHATVDFVGNGLDIDSISGFSSSMISLRSKSLHLLRILWTAPMTSAIVIEELRNNDFLASLLIKELVVHPDSIWEGRTIVDEHFLSTQSAECLWQFMAARTALLQYAAAEVHALSLDQSSTLQLAALKSLIGTTTTPGGLVIQHSNVFEFFDFMELHLVEPSLSSTLTHMQESHFSVCMRATYPPTYDMKWAEEVIALRKADLKNHGHLMTPQDSEAAYDLEGRQLMAILLSKNHLAQYQVARMQGLDAWVKLMLITINLGGLTGTNKTEFLLRILQVISPQLEKIMLNDLEEAHQLAKLAKFVTFSFEFRGEVFEQGDMGDVASDRLFELFRICLRAIHSPIADSGLKEVLYMICYRYLIGMTEVSKGSRLVRRHSIQTIKSAGEKLLNVICDDAYAGDTTCRISAIMLLSALVELAVKDDSDYMIDSLVRLNYLNLMVDSLKNTLNELADASPDDVSLLLSYYTTKLSLLSQISHSRHGATQILNAGLFAAIRESRLFSTDPDLGLTIASSRPVEMHYKLLVSFMRVINVVVLSKGQQNMQVMSTARKFLAENRAGILGVFKRDVRIGAENDTGRNVMVDENLVDELVEVYMVLISISGFLDYEGEQQPKRQALLNSFT